MDVGIGTNYGTLNSPIPENGGVKARVVLKCIITTHWWWHVSSTSCVWFYVESVLNSINLILDASNGYQLFEPIYWVQTFTPPYSISDLRLREFCVSIFSPQFSQMPSLVPSMRWMLYNVTCSVVEIKLEFSSMLGKKLYSRI